MHRFVLCGLLAATALLAEYKSEPAGAPPADLKPGVASLLGKEGYKISDGGKMTAELWLRSSVPTGGKAETSVTLSGVPHGALMGVVRFPEGWADRRGQKIKPGVYTLRYSLMPEDGAHMGASPQRDFLLMVPVADDPGAENNPDYPTLIGLSAKASGTSHPAVLSLWKADAADFKAGSMMTLGEHDQVLHAKAGDTPVAIIVYGKHAE